MKLLKYVMAVFVVMSFYTTAKLEAKGKMVPRIYMFGFSASFTDSVVYFTNVQEVDSAWIDTKSKFLLGRENYSYQLKNYLTNTLGMHNRTCLVVFGKTRKEAEDKYVKMKRMYAVKGKGKYDVRNIDLGKFKFQHIDMSLEEEETGANNIHKKR